MTSQPCMLVVLAASWRQNFLCNGGLLSHHLMSSWGKEYLFLKAELLGSQEKKARSYWNSVYSF